jgi:hypothetical protein
MELSNQFTCPQCNKPLYTDSGFTPHPECESKLAAKQDILMDVGLDQLQRLQHFPSDWISYNKEKGYHVRYTSPKGWLHVMNPSEPFIGHFQNGDDKSIGAATSLWDSSVEPHLQKYKTGLTKEEFLNHTEAAENHFGDDSISDGTPNW